jgi:hypothetical protein
MLLEFNGLDRSWLDENNWVYSKEKVDNDIATVQAARAAARKKGTRRAFHDHEGFCSSSRNHSTEVVETEVESTCLQLQSC